MLSITLFVNDAAASGGDGLGWGTAYDDLQSALTQAATLNADGDTTNNVDAIWIAEGTYHPSTELDPGDARSASFSLIDDVTLYGGFAGTEATLAERDLSSAHTTLSGDLGVIDDTSDNAYTVVYCGQGIEAELNGLWITDGNADLRYMHSTGGGVYNSGTLLLTDSTLSNNSALAGGGGISNDGKATLAVNNSTLFNNSAGSGGAICNGGTLNVTNSTFSGNSAERGGAIYNEDFGYTFTATITNSTIVSNTVTDCGGGIFINAYSTSTITLNNTVVAENDAGNKDDITNIGNSILAGSHNLIGNGKNQSALVDGIDGNLVGTPSLPIDPSLGTLQNNGGPTLTHAPLSGSPLIDAGDSSAATSPEGEPLMMDQRGLLRSYGMVVDIGAVEAQPVGVPIAYGDFFELDQNSTLTLEASDILGNDISTDGSSLTVQVANAPQHGDLVQHLDGTYTYTPEVGFWGSDIFSYRAANGSSESNEVEVLLSVISPQSVIVTTAEDEQDGDLTSEDVSLREALLDLGASQVQFSIDLVEKEILLTLGRLTINDVYIVGLGEQNLAINGNGQSKVFYVNGTDSAISHLTITGGYGYGGAGIDNAGTLAMSNVTLSDNFSTGDGGAIRNQGALTINDSTIIGNSTNGVGGGLWNNGDATVIDSTFAGNESDDSGGGIYNSSNLVVVGSTLFGNTSELGGGISNVGCDLLVINSTLSGNVAMRGGGVYNSSANLTIINSTITGNSTFFFYQYGGGIHNESNSMVMLNNTVVAGNYRDIYTDDGLFSGSNNLIGTGESRIGLVNGVDGNIMGIDPLLGPLQDNGGPTLTHAPLPGSPLLDAGNEAVAAEPSGVPLTTDQRGLTRGFGTVDIGAVESQPSGVPIASGDVFELERNSSLILEEDDFLANDTSIDGSPLSIQVTSTPDHGTLTENLDGTLTYTPEEGFWGTDSFSYQAVNGSLESNVAKVFLLVTDPLSIIVTTADDEQDGDLSPEDISLREAIEDLDASHVQFSSDLLYKEIRLTMGSLAISSDVQIVGHGTEYLSIHGNHQTNVFSLTSGISAISHLTITGGSSTDGGAINNAATLTVSDVVFIDNSASSQGGVIYNNLGNLTVTDSQFIGNSAGYKGGVICQYGGTSNIASLTIANSLFTNNSADQSGGVIAVNYGVMEISGSTFSENSAVRDGGVISGFCIASITKSTFSDNSSGAKGGVIYNGSRMITIVDSTFSGNSASDGGAIHNSSGLTLINSTLSGNSASATGGAIFNDDRLILTNSTVTDNSANDGGGIYNEDIHSNVTLNNSVIAANEAANGPDINVLEGQLSGAHNLIGDGTGQTLFVNGVDGNLVGRHYSPIDPMLGPLQDNGGPTLTHAPLAGSPLIDAGNDSLAINHLEWSFVTDQRSFQRNFGTIDIGAVEFQPEGVPIACDDFFELEQDGSITFSRADLFANDLYDEANPLTLDTYGYGYPEGSTFVENPDGTFTFTPASDFWGHVTFSYRASNGIHCSNMAYAIISVVSPQSVVVTTAKDEQDGDLSPDDISLREALDDLGASQVQFSADLLNQEIQLTMGALNANNVQIIGLGKQHLAINGNRLDSVFDIATGETSISHMTLTGAAGIGSDAAIKNVDGNLTVTRCVIMDNSFGAIFNDTGTTTCIASAIKNNLGSAMYNGTGTLTLIGSSVKYNSTYYDGGAIYNRSGTVEVTDSSLIGNSASRGGAIYSDAGTLAITGSSFLDNSARNRGGGIYTSSATVTITDSTFTGNNAVEDGGAAMASVGTLTFQNSTFFENSAVVRGGAICAPYTSLQITDSTFTDNSAADGGAIYSYKSDMSVTNSSLTENSADNHGGGIFNLGTLNITNSSIAGNLANEDGGGIYNEENTVTLLNSTLSNNSAGDTGGGICCFNSYGVEQKSTLILTNSIFLGNSANGGGGIYCNGGTLAVTNSTLLENASSQVGGGIYAYSTDISLNNSVVAKNEAASRPDLYCYSSTLLGAHNLISIGTVPPTLIDGVDGNQIGSDMSPIDPMLDEAGYPLASSPVIDAGSNQLIPVGVLTDLASNYRISNGTVDVGAYEFNSTPILPGDANGDGKVDGSDVTVLAANWQAGVSDGQTARWAMGDFNGDGRVDGSDVTILAGNWQAGVSSVVVAEPETQPGVDEQQAIELFHAQDALFAENAGQWDTDDVYFGYNKGGTQIYFTDDGLEFGLSRTVDEAADPLAESLATDLELLDAGPETESTHFSLSFDNATPTVPVGADQAVTKFNYYLGGQENWVDGVSTYKTVLYHDLYAGIDLHTFSQHGQMKYEFHVSPGVDYSQIELSYSGIDGLSIGADGSLHIATELGEIVDEDLFIYQTIDGQQVEIAGQFTLLDADTYTFTVTGDYDPTAELVIDPNLDWSTYLVGSGDDLGQGIAVDAVGNVLVTGCTYSSGWVSGGDDTSFNGGYDAFVVKLNTAGDHLWSTYLGGSDSDVGHGIATDAAGNALVTGITDSFSWAPGSSGWVSGGYDTSPNGGPDAFVVKLNTAGDHLWSTYLGGSDVDVGYGIATDAAGNVLVTGETYSYVWVSGGYDTSYNGGEYDAFVVKLNATGDHLWSTYLGGSGTDVGRGITTDAAGNALVTGYTYSSGWISGGDDTSHNGSFDAFVVKLNTAGGHLWSTYLGGSDSDSGYGIATDAAGNALVTGRTHSSGWVSGGDDTSYNGDEYDAFVVKLSTAGNHLWSTYLGGSDSDYGLGIATDAAGNALVTGDTESSGWVSGGDDTSHNGGSDAFVVKLNTTGNHLWSTYLGGSDDDVGYGIATDAAGNALVTGFTYSSGWVSGGDDGDRDAFVVKINDDTAAPGDANRDGRVDGTDVTILAANWQAGVPDGDPENVTWSMGDFNGDGRVDGSDVTILAANWQAGVSSAVVAVADPETQPEEQATRFLPPANASLGIATVPSRESLSPRRLITPTSKLADAVLTESTWSESDYAAIAKDLTAVSVKSSAVKSSTAASDAFFALSTNVTFL